MFEKVDWLAYKLDIFFDWRVHPMFSIAQLKLALFPIINFFYCPHSHIPPTVFIDGDTDAAKSFKVDHLLNKQIVKKSKSYRIEYLVH